MRRSYRKLFYLVSFVIFVIVLNGCKNQSKLAGVVYFQNKDSLLVSLVQNEEPKIQVGDRLSIVVSALNAESVTPYNLYSSPSSGLGGYLVEKDGKIQVPQLGEKDVAGLTRVQLQSILVKELSKFITDPMVTVQFLNFKVTVLGEIAKPGTIQIPEGKLSIIEAIGLAGDLKQYSNRSNILVIREKNGVREFGVVDILSRQVFNSPYYNLAQNDIVYVEPLVDKVESSQAFIKSLSIITTVISLVSTLFFIVLNISK